MSSTLYPYYERELHFIRNEAEEFAKQFPAAAGQLLLDRNQSRDPHVERLIEAFALLSARVEKKLDDEFSEVTDGLLTTLYPHYLAPIPSVAIAKYDADPASPQPTGASIPRGSGLRSQPIEGVACQYRTCYDTTLWPIDVVDAGIEFAPYERELAPPPGTAAVLRIRLRTHAGLLFSELSLDSLRLHLQGDDALIGTLYQHLLCDASRVEIRAVETGSSRLLSTLPAEQAVRPVGFEEDEGLLPYPPTSSRAYRLLTELFAFPQKFAFLDLDGFAEALPSAGEEIDLLVYLNDMDERLANEVDGETFQLGCTPIVNLFEKICEPIRLTHTKTEYPVVPDARRRESVELYSVDRVVGVNPNSTTRYEPLYGLNHENSWSNDDEASAFWHTRRRPSERLGDAGTDVSLRVVDRDFDASRPAEEAITVFATCTNRDLPQRLPSGPNGVRLQSDATTAVTAVRCLRQPTAPMRPPLGKRAYWRLVSHLSLNHLSLTDERFATPALQEILRLYDFADRNENRQRAISNSEMIDGVVGVKTRRTACRIGGPRDGGFCRGIAVELELDEQQYRDVGAYLFASVMERFFAEYATVNSFTRTTLKTKQSGVLKTWAPRSGSTPLL